MTPASSFGIQGLDVTNGREGSSESGSRIKIRFHLCIFTKAEDPSATAKSRASVIETGCGGELTIKLCAETSKAKINGNAKKRCDCFEIRKLKKSHIKTGIVLKPGSSPGSRNKAIDTGKRKSTAVTNQIEKNGLTDIATNQHS